MGGLEVPAGGYSYLPGVDGTLLGEEESTGTNRFSGIEERKRSETDAKAGGEIPERKKADTSTRVKAPEGPAEDPDKYKVLEKLKDREHDS